jgi:hypothetical protein
LILRTRNIANQSSWLLRQAELVENERSRYSEAVAPRFIVGELDVVARRLSDQIFELGHADAELFGDESLVLSKFVFRIERFSQLFERFVAGYLTGNNKAGKVRLALVIPILPAGRMNSDMPRK